jgi:Fur family ferric uptake transcriptional regulator
VQDHEAKLAAYLRERRLKFTRQRRTVMEEAFAEHEHFEADELLRRMREKKLRVSKATLYRTLALLVQAGLLRQEVFGERHSHYEHIYGHRHHDHLLCLGCGKIEEFRNDDIERLQNQICNKYAFTPTDHQLEIHGYCRKCREERG